MVLDDTRLEKANRHVMQGMQQLLDQERRFARLASAGRDTAEAGKLLAQFREALQARVQHRHAIIVSLGKQRSALRHQYR